MNNMVSDIDWEALKAELEELEDTEDDVYTMEDYYNSKDPSRYTESNSQSKPQLLEVGANKKKVDDDFDSDYITDKDIEDHAYLLYPEKKTYRSILLEIFTVDQCIEIEKISRSFSITNNQKIDMMKQKFTEWGIDFNPLGGGTNRYGFAVDGYAIKVACDKDGKIDNKREFKYSRALQPYVIKCYETFSDGLFAVFEYVESFSLDDYWKNQDAMREILMDIGSNFLIGDVGITSTNYNNWGYRDDGDIVILDFAYIYSVTYKSFTCSCNAGSSLYYNKDFTDLICPVCGKKYSFKDIRKKISRKDQDEEIGDIDDQGIIITKPEQEAKFNPNFTYGAYDKIFKLLLKKKKRRDKKVSQTSQLDEIMNSIDVHDLIDEKY